MEYSVEFKFKPRDIVTLKTAPKYQKVLLYILGKIAYISILDNGEEVLEKTYRVRVGDIVRDFHEDELMYPEEGQEGIV